MSKRLLSFGAVLALALAPGLALAQEGLGPAVEDAARPDAAQPDAEKAAPLAARDFLEKTAQANLAEMRLGNLALEKSQNEAVRAFAQEMIADHASSQLELGDFFSKQGLNFPSEPAPDQQTTFARLSRVESGAEFDREFAKAMVSEHEKAVSLFERASASLEDPALKAFAVKTLPTLRHHLEMARKLAGDVGAR